MDYIAGICSDYNGRGTVYCLLLFERPITLSNAILTNQRKQVKFEWMPLVRLAVKSVDPTFTPGPRKMNQMKSTKNNNKKKT